MPAPTLPTAVSSVTRRRFLTCSGVTAGAVVAGGAATLSCPQLFAAAQRTPLDPQAGVLVVVTLYGGNDGLNTVVPAGDPAYAAARPDLAYRPDEMLDVGTGLGLNPGLKGLKSLWDDKSLAIVHGVGYLQPDRSHFASMAIWQCGSPGTPATSGWLGRWLDLAPDPVKALALDPVLPPLLAGTRTAGSTLGRTRLALPRGVAGRTVAGLALPSPSDGPWQAAAATSLGDLVKASGTFHDAVAEIDDQQDETTAPGGSAGGQSDLAKQLAIVAGWSNWAYPRGSTRYRSAGSTPIRTNAVPKSGCSLSWTPPWPASPPGWPRPSAAGRWSPWSIRSSAAGCTPTPPKAPTTAPPARCSCSAAACRAATTAPNPASPTSTKATFGRPPTFATCAARCSPACSAPTRARC